MAIYSFGDKVPNIHPSAFVHPEAVIIGDVSIGEMSFIGPCAVLRGDSSRIEIGARTSIQDGSVIHCTAELPTIVGDECTVGHNAHLEGCTVQSGALVGSGSLVLHKAVVESGALVAAGAVVLGGTLDGFQGSFECAACAYVGVWGCQNTAVFKARVWI